METLLVTGDVVLDCHLYGGVKTAATSFREPGTVFTQHLGGAVLTHRLVSAAADARGLAWDEHKRQWEDANALRRKERKRPLERPDELEEVRPSPAFATHLDLDTANLERTLPLHLRSFGVWTPHPRRRGSKEQVWRAAHHFGYGPTTSPAAGGVFRRDPASPSKPLLTLIDDGAILFRQSAAQGVWPRLARGGSGLYLLKMSSPLCRGDLWAALEPVLDRLVVVVAATDLRLQDTQINARLSWERCAEHTLCALRADPVARELLRAAHVVVTFRSAGALWVTRALGGQAATDLLFFDPTLMEGHYSRDFEGTVYGFQTCVAASIAHHLMQEHSEAVRERRAGPFAHRPTLNRAMSRGITAGLLARRRLLELGHGRVGDPDPGLPIEAIGRAIATASGTFEAVAVPEDACPPVGCPWTILAQSEGADGAPLSGLAELTARYGFGALSHLPALSLGSLFTVDRGEIECLRALEALIRAYEDVKVQKKPLSIGVFGPPGAGKSFGVKALAKGILGDKVPFLEFNLSQFKSPDELIGAFHRVRDAVLGGITPVAFWDEFDSRSYEWLQYLLAPMQDGAFQEGQVTHPIGKCIFVFAGGTSSTIEAFGVEPPEEIRQQDIDALGAEKRTRRLRELDRQRDLYQRYKQLKGPDFVSRLHGFLNVLGPNPNAEGRCPDITWPIRRAIVLRHLLDLAGDDELDIDAGLLNALLGVRAYRHGARSFEKIVNDLKHDRLQGRLVRSALPPQPVLERETDAVHFLRLLSERDAFKNHPDIEALAAAVHYGFLRGAEKSRVDAAIRRTPHVAWTIHPSIVADYDNLSPDFKASNRAAARRIPDHLALIGFTVEPQRSKRDSAWKAPLVAAIEKHLDRLARAEHLGWCAERTANGWTPAEARDDHRKHHDLLVPWAKLRLSDQDKDRTSVRTIPTVLEVARFKAVPVAGPAGPTKATPKRRTTPPSRRRRRR